MNQYTNENELESILRSFSFVGIFEDFERTICFLSDYLSLDPVPVRENQKAYAQTLKKSDVSKAQLEQCCENNLLDSQLYKLAQDRFKVTHLLTKILEPYRTLPFQRTSKTKVFQPFDQSPLLRENSGYFPEGHWATSVKVRLRSFR